VRPEVSKDERLLLLLRYLSMNGILDSLFKLYMRNHLEPPRCNQPETLTKKKRLPLARGADAFVQK